MFMEKQQYIAKENADILEDRAHGPQPLPPQQSYIRVAFPLKPTFVCEISGSDFPRFRSSRFFLARQTVDFTRFFRVRGIFFQFFFPLVSHLQGEQARRTEANQNQI